MEIEMGAVGGAFPAGALVAAEQVPEGLQVQFESGSVTLLAEWLRDNCPCSTCRIVQTDERRIRPWTMPAPAISHVEVSATLDDWLLDVRWADAHRSTYTAGTFQALEVATRRGSHRIRLWRGGDELERLQHDDVLHSNGGRRRFFETFQRDGAVVVVAGAPTPPGSVLSFMAGINVAVRDFSIGRIFDVLVDPAGFNIAYTAEDVPPHNDFANYTNPPSGQVLAMLVNDAAGGRSSVVDGWSVLHTLAETDPAAIDILSRVQVGFRQYSSTADAFSRSTLVERDPEGRFTHLRFSNQLMQPLPFDHPELAAWYRAYRALGECVSDPANHVSFRLHAGDMLFVNNHRVLHAREAFSPDGARHLQDVYFDADEITGNLARLTGDASNAMVHQ
jgi:gamma-butyrobetaine dioxygenase